MIICFSTLIIGTDYNTRKKLIWGQGRLDMLKEQQLQFNATAIMVNIDILSPHQQVIYLQCLFINLFRLH